MFQQFVGINVIFYYGATLWQLAGFTEGDALLINIGSGVVSIAACFVTIAVIDRIGRKPLLLIGSAGIASVPIAARVSHIVAYEANPKNLLIYHAMGPNLAGVFGTAISGGILLALLGVGG